MNVIKLQTQTLWNNCTCTCIAMITNQDVDKITEDFHKRYIEGYEEESSYFKEMGMEFKEPAGSTRHPKPNKIYLLGVPSLNIKGGMHSVVMETIDEGCWLYDPNQGRGDGRMYYVAGNAQGDLEFNLTSYFLAYEFDRDYIKNSFYS